MKLSVDKKQRFAKMRAHTAAHLLHAELESIVNGTKQAGSYVDEDYLRFDFSTSKPLTEAEIKTIEDMVNKTIYEAHDIVKKEMSFDEAISLGAKAFFEDKYGDTVRVISIKNEDTEKFISVELCGGTHANNTADLGAFKIISQEAVASGIRRITAVTGTKVVEYLKEKQNILDNVCSRIGAETDKQIQEKLEKTLKEFSETKSAFESVQDQMIGTALLKLSENSKKNEDFGAIIELDEKLGSMDFKSVVTKARDLIKDKNVIIYNKGGSVAIFTVMGVSAKTLAQKYKIKGGGSDSLFQGRDEKVTTLF